MNKKRLQTAVDILKERYKHEIHNTGDWFYFLRDYTINIHDNEGSNTFVTVVYPVDKSTSKTDYCNQINLASFPKEFQLAMEN
jgi:hypothetical protein